MSSPSPPPSPPSTGEREYAILQIRSLLSRMLGRGNVPPASLPVAAGLLAVRTHEVRQRALNRPPVAGVVRGGGGQADLRQPQRRPAGAGGVEEREHLLQRHASQLHLG